MTQHPTPPDVAAETWRALFKAAAAFAALRPWLHLTDAQVVGLVDSQSGDTRIAAVLGNQREAFGAMVHRHPTGLNWLFRMLQDESAHPGPHAVEGLDCLMLEFVPKKELLPPDLAALKAAQFRPTGRGPVRPPWAATS